MINNFQNNAFSYPKKTIKKTRKKVRIGIIDSGFNFSVDIRNSITNSATILDSVNNVTEISENRIDCFDTWGHGTTCCQIIDSYCDNIEFIIVKIFDSKNKSNVSKISKAIQYCIEKKANIINMSVGFQSYYMPDDLIHSCQMAHDTGLILTAAISNSNSITFPANYPLVIGVGKIIGGPISENNIFRYPYDPTLVYTPGKDFIRTECINASSFSCARITGIISTFLAKNENLSFAEIKNILSSNSRILPNYILQTFENNTHTQYEPQISTRELRNILNKYCLFHNEQRIGKRNRVLLLTDENNDSNIKYLQQLEHLDVELFDPYKYKNSDLLQAFMNELHSFEYVGISMLDKYISKSIFRKIIDYIIHLNIKLVVFDDYSFQVLNLIYKDKKQAHNLFLYKDVENNNFQELSHFRFLPSTSIPKVAFLSTNREDTWSTLLQVRELVKRSSLDTALVSRDRYKSFVDNAFILPPYLTNNISLEEESLLINNLLRGLQHIGNYDCLIYEINSLIMNKSQLDFSWLKNRHNLMSLRPSLIIIDIDTAMTVQMYKEIIQILNEIIDNPNILLTTNSDANIEIYSTIEIPENVRWNGIFNIDNIDSEKEILNLIKVGYE